MGVELLVRHNLTNFDKPDMVRVLSTILRFTPQETRRLIAKV